jgi:hypothetical protein
VCLNRDHYRLRSDQIELLYILTHRGLSEIKLFPNNSVNEEYKVRFNISFIVFASARYIKIQNNFKPLRN